MNDNLFGALYPWLEWVPTWDPRSGEPGHGFESYDAVELRCDAAPMFLELLGTLRTLMGQAPARVELQSGWRLPWRRRGAVSIRDQTWYTEELYPSRVSFDKEEALATLGGLIDLTRRLIERGEDSYIMQVGL